MGSHLKKILFCFGTLKKTIAGKKRNRHSIVSFDFLFLFLRIQGKKKDSHPQVETLEGKEKREERKEEMRRKEECGGKKNRGGKKRYAREKKRNDAKNGGKEGEEWPGKGKKEHEK